MFLGHIGLAFAAKRVAPRASFGTALLATDFADCLWPLFLSMGIEQVRVAPGVTRMTPLDFVSYPWSHSLLMDGMWALGFATTYLALRRYPTGAWMAALGVMSHWVLDWWSHRPDMPLTPWSAQKYGLGLWNSVGSTITAELGLFLLGLAMYITRTKSKDRIGGLCVMELRCTLVGDLDRGCIRPTTAKRDSGKSDRVCVLVGRRVGVLDRQAPKACTIEPYTLIAKACAL